MITARPSAPLGTILRPSSYSPADFPLGSVILARNTSPLVSFCYNLLARDVPCRIAGKDIGKGLADLVKAFKVTTTVRLKAAVATWVGEQSQKALAEGRSPERYFDQSDAIHMLCKDTDFVDEVLCRIDRIFAEDGEGRDAVLLSTIHKFKGGEASRVFLLDFDRLLPSRYARTPSALRQERNLQYVAVTRSSDTLVFIESDRWEDAEPQS